MGPQIPRRPAGVAKRRPIPRRASSSAARRWLGLFEAGEDESGDWQWVDTDATSGYRAWNPGEPNEWCTDEDCAVFAPRMFHGWVDASCTIEGWAVCLCRYGGHPSEAYKATRPELDANSHDYEEQGCLDHEDEDESEDEREAEAAGDGRRYCGSFGMQPRDWDEERVAYPPDNRRHPAERAGFREGTCGYSRRGLLDGRREVALFRRFAAFEHDDQWARCCCLDEAFCTRPRRHVGPGFVEPFSVGCPWGEDKDCKSADDWDWDEDE